MEYILCRHTLYTSFLPFSISDQHQPNFRESYTNCACYIGFTLILIVSPVAADLSAVVEAKEKADPDAFGPGGAYGQAFALFNCSMAAATLFGPVVAGALVERHGWGVMTAAMGVFAFSGAIPAVSHLPVAPVAFMVRFPHAASTDKSDSFFTLEVGYSTKKPDP